MVTIKNNIENQIRQLESKINIPNIETLAKDLVDQKLISTTTKLGAELQTVAAGFKSLTTGIDDVVKSIPSSIPQNITGKLVIAEMTEKVPEVANKLKQAVGGAAADIQKITGTATAAADAMLDVVIALPTPQAIAAAVKKAVPDATVNQLEKIAEQTVDLTKRIGINEFQKAFDFDLNLDGLQQSLKKAIGPITKIANNIDDVKNQLTNAIGLGKLKALQDIAKGFESVIENAVESILSPASNLINTVAVINNVKQTISSGDLRQIIALVAKTDIQSAAKRLQKFSDRPINELVDTLKKIDNRLSSTTSTSTPGVPTTAKDIEGIKNNWSSTAASKTTFELIDSKEELIADLQAAKREITEVVVHHTFTGLNVNIKAEDINIFSERDYGKSIPYHYVFTRDGFIQRGRPISVELDIPLANNHQQRSIQVCFVGGLNTPEGSARTPDFQKHLSKRSFTREQWAAFDLFIDALYTVYPYTQMLGHSSIDPENLDPGFDPSEYVESKFGKKLAFKDPSNEPPFTRNQLIKRFLAT